MALVPATVVFGGGGTGDLEDPDVFLGGAGFVEAAPAQIVEGRLDGLVESGVEAVDEDGVEAGAIVDFVEVGVGAAGGAGPLAIGVRPSGIRALAWEVGGGDEERSA